MPLNISPRDVGWISRAQTQISSTQNPVRIQVPGKAQEQGLTACDLLALCSPTITPLHGKVASVPLYWLPCRPSRAGAKVNCDSSFPACSPLMWSPHAVSGSGGAQAKGSKGSWCPREATVHESCTSPREKHGLAGVGGGEKSKRKNTYLVHI